MRLKSRFHNLPIFYKILLFFSILVLFLILLTGFNYIVYSRQNEAAAYRSTYSAARQAANEIETYLQDIKSLSLLPLSRQFDEHDLPFLLADIDGKRQWLLEAENSLGQLAKDIFNFKRDIQSVLFVTPKGRMYAFFSKTATPVDFEPAGMSWFEPLLSSGGEAYFLSPFPLVFQRDLTRYDTRTFSVARAIVEVPSAMVRGAVLINTECTYFDAIMRRLTLYDGQRMVVLDGQGNAVYDSAGGNLGVPVPQALNDFAGQNAQTGRLTLDGTEYLAGVHSVSLPGWTLMNLVPAQAVNQELRWMLDVTVVLLGVILLLAVLISYLMGKHISEPLKRLSQTMQRVKNQDFSMHMDVDRTDEIGQLSESFNSMLDEINRLINVVYVNKLTQKELELSMLQSQINPHFLYNTLESISMMAEVNDDTAAARMATALGKILRYSISGDGVIVSLGEELYVLKQYILLQEERLGHQFAIEENISPSLYEHAILRLTLQPIVENAIYHGMNTLKLGGRISITGEECPDCVKLRIADNGRGMPPERLNALRESITRDGEMRDRIGLRNVNRRLKLYFGEAYGLIVDSTEGRGTVVTVILPREI